MCFKQASTTRLLFSAAAMVLGANSVSQAAQYSFLNCTSTGATSSQFSGTNGVINATHTFSAGGAGSLDNVNTAIFPSQFTTVFPGTGQVQGNLGMTVYNHPSTMRFSMSGYNITPNTIFGMWNITDEVTAGPGSPFVYQLQLIDAGGFQVSPSTFAVYGQQDNQTQVQGRHLLDLNTTTGEISPGAVINGGVGTHTSATFWNGIPVGTKEILVYANLPPLNNIGDGVGYYFAEQVVPEPTAIAAIGATALGRRRRR